jgi:serine/threonine-protein phosphatase 2A regulatory subunit B''
VIPADLAPFVRAVVETHPSLAFLKDEFMFQEKFIEFIVARCFIVMDTDLRGIATLTQFRQVDLSGMFRAAEGMKDVNEAHHIFNYQHFYVAFCKFWDLDTDSDGLISKEDLAKHNESAVSPRIIDRFFNSNFYPRSANKNQPIDFTAFSYFIMFTEDKTTLTAINFWYKLCDLDDDGLLSLKEIEDLYEQQFERMSITGNETIPFGDILRQLWDMINPRDAAFITVADLIKSKMADVFFNTVFDLQKFLIREYQYPIVNPDLDELTAKLSPWEVYVLMEYDQLASDAG